MNALLLMTSIFLFLLFLLLVVMFGPWWSHVKGYWELRNEPNILFLKFEDIVKVNSMRKFLLVY